MAEERPDVQLNPEHRKLILTGLQEVITYLQAGVKTASKIEDPEMFLAEVRTKVHAGHGMLEGVCDKTYVAREDLREQEAAQDPVPGRTLRGDITLY